MPSNPPLTASGPREAKRPRSIPRPIRHAIVLMVRGRPDDPDGQPLDFIQAARIAGITPYVLRRYFDRPSVVALLHAERRAWRALICAGNEGALKRVRDTSENGMATVAAIRQLEAIDETDAERGRGTAPSPGIVINIIRRDDTAPEPAPAPVTIDARPMPAIEDRPRRDSAANPVFNPYQGWPHR